MLTGFFAALVLFIKYQLEEFRLEFQSEIAARIGAELTTKSVQVNGLHGLRIEEFEIILQVPNGPLCRVTVPEVFVNVDFLDLFYRKITIEEIQADNAEITLTRSVGTRWLQDDFSTTLNSLGGSSDFGFRVLGKNSRLNIENVVGASNIYVDSVYFDILNRVNSR